MKSVTIIFFFVVSFNAYGKSRTIDLNKEIREASYVGEVIFTGFDSILINKYGDSYYPIIFDSINDTSYIDKSKMNKRVYNLYQVRLFDLKKEKDFTAGLKENLSWNYYRMRPDSFNAKLASHGYWPRTGDTCLIILDKENNVSVIAHKKTNDYVFWDPYNNNSWTTTFIFNGSFKCLDYRNDKWLSDVAMRRAKNYDKESGCAFHVKIARNEFWENIISGK